MNAPPPPLSCPACAAGALDRVGGWSDWEAQAATRPDGPARLAAADACGYAARLPEIMKCRACGSVFLTPSPTPEEIDAFRRQFRAPAEYVSYSDRNVARAWRRVALIGWRAPGERFLEIGAVVATGAEAARRLGFDATALITNAQAHAAGANLFPQVRRLAGGFDALAPDDHFDFVYLADIIEQAPDPLGFIQKVVAHMTPGAILFAATPDAGHWRTPKDIMTFDAMAPPEHASLFTRAGIKALFTRAGLARVGFRLILAPGVRAVAVKPRL